MYPPLTPELAANRARYNLYDETHREQRRAYSAAHRFEARTKLLKKRYQLTPEQFQAMLDKQNNRCLSCGKVFGTGYMNRAEVDHDHGCCPGRISCGKCVRGILCGQCNRLLGLVEKSIPLAKCIME